MKKVDYHIHTSFSDGKPCYREVIDKAKKAGMYCIAITDHFDRYDHKEKISSITEESMIEFLREVKAYAEEAGQYVLCGIETCTGFDGRLRIGDRLYNACDIIITSPHYLEYEGELVPGNYFDEKYWNAYMEKLINIASGEGHILGHPEAYLPYGGLLVPNTTTFESRKKLALDISNRFFDESFIDRLAKALKKSGKAYELHCITQTPRESVIEKLAEHGVRMSLGSDAHELLPACDTGWGQEMLLKHKCGHLQFIV